jgi:hypothetical protein
MKNRRVTITILNGVSDFDALQRIAEVVKRGKISKTNERDHYTFKTVWEDGVFVETRAKYKSESDRFIVGRDLSRLEILCPDCDKPLVLEDGDRNLFSCSCGNYKIQTNILIKIASSNEKTKGKN